ncbi:MAG: hypothetical protein ACRYHQ_06465 [Janthinobacterium lividum]
MPMQVAHERQQRPNRAPPQAALRTFFARCVVARRAVGNPPIRAEFATVPREPFASPAPIPSGIHRVPGQTGRRDRLWIGNGLSWRRLEGRLMQRQH